MPLLTTSMFPYFQFRRWEVYHGQSEDSLSKWERQTNPRRTSSLCLEDLRFAIDESVLEKLEENGQSVEKTAAAKLLAATVSPSVSGVYDELLALIRSDVLIVDSRGVPLLAKDWWTRVDILMLDEMAQRFGMRADPKGQHGICENVRKKLGRTWVRTERGWAFASDVDDVIFDFDEFDEWHQAYQEKQKNRSDGVDGIGRFGTSSF
jgi:hypothetical protein